VRLSPAQPRGPRDTGNLSLPDRWILSRHSRALQTVARELEQYNLAQAADAPYAYVWSEFCDWYVELAKTALYGDNLERKAHTQAVLAELLSGILRALHPFIPFITEEIWQRWRPQDGPLAFQAFPAPNADAVDAEAEARMHVVQDVLSAARSLRADFGITPGAKAPLTLIARDEATRSLLEDQAEAFATLAWAPETAVLAAPAEQPKATVSAIVAGIEVYLHIGEAVDIPAELSRLDKQIATAEASAERSRKKLASEGFTGKAPAAVIEEERGRLREAEATAEKLRVQREALAEMA